LNANFPGKGAQELGAEYVGPTQDRVLALAAELGLPIFKTYTAGNSSFFRKGTVIHYRDVLGGIPPIGIDSLIELGIFMEKVNILASTVDIEKPWNTPNATALDSVTLETYVDSRISTADSRMLLNIIVPSLLSTEMREPSLLYSLWGISGAGNATVPGSIARLIAVEGGAQESRLDGGSQLLAIKLAEKLEPKNIVFNAPVRNVKLEKAR
jgi:monoamine oxidase